MVSVTARSEGLSALSSRRPFPSSTLHPPSSPAKTIRSTDGSATPCSCVSGGFRRRSSAGPVDRALAARLRHSPDARLQEGRAEARVSRAKDRRGRHVSLEHEPLRAPLRLTRAQELPLISDGARIPFSFRRSVHRAPPGGRGAASRSRSGRAPGGRGSCPRPSSRHDPLLPRSPRGRDSRTD
jgi:hypothetical protein